MPAACKWSYGLFQPSAFWSDQDIKLTNKVVRQQIKLQINLLILYNLTF